ncbi:MAG: hypothetical protein PUA78_07255 [Porphyromonadaceae bacterium]|nr:hypothetical protein [Porphyromonadaceae bacterium]
MPIYRSPARQRRGVWCVARRQVKASAGCRFTVAPHANGVGGCVARRQVKASVWMPIYRSPARQRRGGWYEARMAYGIRMDADLHSNEIL